MEHTRRRVSSGVEIQKKSSMKSSKKRDLPIVNGEKRQRSSHAPQLCAKKRRQSQTHGASALPEKTSGIPLKGDETKTLRVKETFAAQPQPRAAHGTTPLKLRKGQSLRKAAGKEKDLLCDADTDSGSVCSASSHGSHSSPSLEDKDGFRFIQSEEEGEESSGQSETHGDDAAESSSSEAVEPSKSEADDDDDDDDDSMQPAYALLEKKNALLLNKRREEVPDGSDLDVEVGNVVGADDATLLGLEDAPAGAPFTGDLAAVKQRIAHLAQLLANWSNVNRKQRALNSQKEQGNVQSTATSRADIMAQFVQDVALYYGYSHELASYFLELFSPIDAISFFEAVDAPRPVTLRTNMLNTRRRDLAKALIARGCNVDPIGDWSKVGLKVIESSVPVGATPEYCAGHYMIQSASSFVPVMALAPQPGELVLDMAAAPGGKSTYIGQLMKNSGVLFCNEIKKERTPALVANIHRMGVTNAIVFNMDGAELVGKIPLVDRVLLDAPCTGLGVISRDPSVKVKRTVKDFKVQAALQKRLLAAAVDLCNAQSPTGGYVVYSTCSLSVEENEEVVDYILKARHVKVVPMGIDIGEPGLSNYRQHRFHPSLKETRRIYPHTQNMDGFFVCKLKKLSDHVPERVKKDRRTHNAYVKTWGAEKWKPEYLDQELTFDDTEVPELSGAQINADTASSDDNQEDGESS